MSHHIKTLHPRRIWDSRGRPQIEVDVILENGITGRGIAPAGASIGAAEAIELRDGGRQFNGYDVQTALTLIRDELAPALVGLDVSQQYRIDTGMMMLDGTPEKSRLGANSLVAVSMACLDAAAKSAGLPVWKYLARDQEVCMPLPEIQILAGGAHANRQLDLQDLMVIAVGADDFETALNWSAEVYMAAGNILNERGQLFGTGDEGGYWPVFDTNEAAIELLIQAIEKSGRKPGDEMSISIDIAASELYREGFYHFARDKRKLTSEALVELLESWVNRYPIVSVEDPLAETDHPGMQHLTRKLGQKLQIVGDDYFVTNSEKILHGGESGACNAALIKPNQAGTLTEARTAFESATRYNFDTIVSARSGESEDTLIMHLAIGWGAKQIKVGSMARSERTAKWNEGLRIAEQIGGELPPRTGFPWCSPK